MERNIAAPPNLDLPDDNPCLKSGSRPKLKLENNINNANAIIPLMPVKNMVTNKTSKTLDPYPFLSMLLFI